MRICELSYKNLHNINTSVLDYTADSGVGVSRIQDIFSVAVRPHPAIGYVLNDAFTVHLAGILAAILTDI
jgi:hypothetical protein